ncbi:hypothetical protein ACHAXS_000580 [Conticribra weissflogii]
MTHSNNPFYGWYQSVSSLFGPNRAKVHMIDNEVLGENWFSDERLHKITTAVNKTNCNNTFLSHKVYAPSRKRNKKDCVHGVNGTHFPLKLSDTYHDVPGVHSVSMTVDIANYSPRNGAYPKPTSPKKRSRQFGSTPHKTVQSPCSTVVKDVHNCRDSSGLVDFFDDLILGIRDSMTLASRRGVSKLHIIQLEVDSDTVDYPEGLDSNCIGSDEVLFDDRRDSVVIAKRRHARMSRSFR